MDALHAFFDASRLAPHGYCLLWRPELVWLHVMSDGLIGVAYYSIPLALAYFVWKRQDLAFSWIFWMFAAFILACGTTHLFEIWTLWHPDYGTQGLIKAATAGLSVLTAAILWPLLPQALALPSPASLRHANECLTTEIRERNHAVERLGESESRFRRFYEKTPVPLHSTTPDGRIVTISEHWLGLLGYRRDEVVGRPLADFMAPGEPAPPLGDSRDGEYRFVRRDGVVLDCRLSTRVEREPDGSFGHNLGVLVDISARKRAEAALQAEIAGRQRAEERLRQAEKMEAIGQLTGGIAHDFNNLLTVILGGLERLRRQLGERRELEWAILASQRAAALTSQLLAFARREALQPAAIDVNRQVEATTVLLRRTLGEGIALETVLAADLWAAYADPNRLETALLNLVLNARDAMPEGGRLTIATGNADLDHAGAQTAGDLSPGHYVLVVVTDTGTGMAADVMSRAFEPFFTTKGVGRGTGLGLSQVYGFVKQSRGHVGIDSEPGRGTAIRIYLPRAEAGLAPAKRRSEDSVAPGARQGERILVVEDNPEVLEYMSTLLRDLGYETTTVTSAEAAMAQLERARPTLLLTDVGLPGRNGRQLADDAQAAWPDLPVLFTTGYAHDAIATDGSHALGMNILNKPFTADALARAIREAIDAGTR